MFNIAYNGIVTVNRGDSFELPLSLNVGTSLYTLDYILAECDHVYFGLMEPNQPFETAIVRKVLTHADQHEDGKLYIRFWPEDTRLLLPGKYYYQVKLQTVDAATGRKDVETIVDKTLFYIEE